ncbi:MAG: hypothetical protein ACXVCH_05850 [Bdellovibrionota bacterium]
MRDLQNPNVKRKISEICDAESKVEQLDWRNACESTSISAKQTLEKVVLDCIDEHRTSSSSSLAGVERRDQWLLVRFLPEIQRLQT